MLQSKIRFIILLFIFVPAICFAGKDTIFQAFRELHKVNSSGDPSSNVDAPSTDELDVFFDAKSPFSFYNSESEAFDKKILELCGNLSSSGPTGEEFIAMLNKPENAFIAKTIYEELDHKVITENTSLDKFIEELAQIWFHQNGFAHVFCGQPKNKKLRGLHFSPRLDEVSQNEWAKIIEHKSEPVHDTVDIVKIEFLNKKREIRQKNMLTVDKTLHANDILVYATQAFKMIKDKEGEVNYGLNGYTGIFVKRDNAIITFYPKLLIPVDSHFLDSDNDLEADSAYNVETNVISSELPGDDFYKALETLMKKQDK